MNDKQEESKKLINQFKRLSLSPEGDRESLSNWMKEDKNGGLDSSSDSDSDLFTSKKAKVDLFNTNLESSNDPFEFKFCTENNEATKDEIVDEKVDQQVIQADKQDDKQENQQEDQQSESEDKQSSKQSNEENHQENQQENQQEDQQSESEDDNGKELSVQFEQLPSNQTYLDPDQFYNDDDVFENEQQFSNVKDDSFNKFGRRLTLEQIPEEDNNQSAEKEDSQLDGFEVVSAESIKNEIINKQEVDDSEEMEKEVQESDETSEKAKESDETSENAKESDERTEDNQMVTEELNLGSNNLEESSLNHQEDKIEKWRIDNEEKIKLKDAKESESNNELMINAKIELEEWYTSYQAHLKAKKNKNRLYETDLVNASEKKAKSRLWSTVVDLCDFSFKGGQKDTSRFKSVLIKIKESDSSTIA